jgi:hypothetical protein
MSADEVQGGELRFNPPSELPVLTREVSRILLDMLIRLTEVEAPDGPREGRADDC